MRITRRGFVGALGAWGVAACAGSRPWSPIGGAIARDSATFVVEGARVFDGGAHVAVWSGARLGVWSVPADGVGFALESVWPLVGEADTASLLGVVGMFAIGPSVLLAVTSHRTSNLATRIDVATGERHELGRLHAVRRVFASRDGALLVSGDAVIDAATLATRFTLPDAPDDVAFLADQRHAACAYADRVLLVELATGAVARELPMEAPVTAIAAHPIEPRLYLAMEHDVVVQDLVSDASQRWTSKARNVETMAALADGSLLIASIEELEQLLAPDGDSAFLATFDETTTIPVTVEVFPVVAGHTTRALLTTERRCSVVDLVHHRLGADVPVPFSDRASEGAT